MCRQLSGTIQPVFESELKLVSCSETYLGQIEKQPRIVRPVDLRLTPAQKNFYHIFGITSGIIIFIMLIYILIKCYQGHLRKKEKKASLFLGNNGSNHIA